MISHIRGMFQHNLLAKIIALIVAAGIWVYVMNNVNPTIEKTYSLAVRTANVPEGYKISLSDEYVSLKVKGPRSAYVNLNTDELKAIVNLESIKDGENEVRIQTMLPQGFELVDCTPDVITVRADRVVTKQVRVDLIVTGVAANGYTVGKIEPSQESVSVQGPESLLAQVSRVIGYVGLVGNDKDFSLDIPLSAVDNDGRAVANVTVIPQSIKADVQIARGLTRKVVSIKPVFSGEPVAGHVVDKVKIDPSKIEIAGDNDKLEKVTSIDTEKIDLSTRSKPFSCEAVLELPDGITVTNKNVSVQIFIVKK